MSKTAVAIPKRTARTKNQKDVGQIYRIFLSKQRGVEHDHPGITAGLCADGMKRKGKIPVGKRRNAKSLPKGKGFCVHGGGLAGNGNAGLFPKADQITDDPGKTDGHNDHGKD